MRSRRTSSSKVLLCVFASSASSSGSLERNDRLCVWRLLLEPSDPLLARLRRRRRLVAFLPLGGGGRRLSILLALLVLLGVLLLLLQRRAQRRLVGRERRHRRVERSGGGVVGGLVAGEGGARVLQRQGDARGGLGRLAGVIVRVRQVDDDEVAHTPLDIPVVDRLERLHDHRHRRDGVAAGALTEQQRPGDIPVVH